MATARTRRAVFRTGDSVVIEARAHWRAALTGLEVSAVVHGPGRSVHRLRLRDGDLLSPDAGTYLGEFRPAKAGRHTALVRIVNTQQAMRADTHHRITHAAPDVAIDMRAGIGAFQRVVPLTFEVLPT